MLCASGPDVSVCPVALMRALPLLLNAADACLTTFSDASDSLELSQSKNTMKDGGAVEGGGGGGAEETGGATFTGRTPSR